MDWVRVCAAPGCREPMLDRKPEAIYCSDVCRKRGERARRRKLAVTGGVDDPDYLGAVTGACTVTPAALRTVLKPMDAFERLREGKVLSRWKPDPKATGEDMPDIPEFLRR
jgi:hypothetical protein